MRVSSAGVENSTGHPEQCLPVTEVQPFFNFCTHL